MRSPRPSGTPLRKGGRRYLNFFIAVSLALNSCVSPSERSASRAGTLLKHRYSVYLVNRGIHTGLIIPVNGVSVQKISAMKFFEKSEYIDFGWGEEYYYQHPGKGKFCLGVKAVAVPNSSVVRAEGFSAILEDVIEWSDYALRFDLTESEFINFCGYIDGSFRRDENNNLIETSRKRNGEVIFFKSVYYYHAFNTCNTWAARGLQYAGLDVSPFLVITAGDLFDEVKGSGVPLK